MNFKVSIEFGWYNNKSNRTAFLVAIFLYGPISSTDILEKLEESILRGESEKGLSELSESQGYYQKIIEIYVKLQRNKKHELNILISNKLLANFNKRGVWALDKLHFYKLYESCLIYFKTNLLISRRQYC